MTGRWFVSKEWCFPCSAVPGCKLFQVKWGSSVHLSHASRVSRPVLLYKWISPVTYQICRQTCQSLLHVRLVRQHPAFLGKHPENPLREQQQHCEESLNTPPNCQQGCQICLTQIEKGQRPMLCPLIAIPQSLLSPSLCLQCWCLACGNHGSGSADAC